jgi:hypothetical protein
MIAIFMGAFGQECYPLFNSAAVEHFEGKPFTISNDYKSNVIRIWEKINEYQKDSYYVKLQYYIG